MQDSDWSPLHVIWGAITSVLGWTVVIMCIFLAGFCCGYWIGHRQVTNAAATLSALQCVPVVWMVDARMFIAYVVTALAIYLPLRYESRWLHLCAAVATFLTWLVVVALVVELTSHFKFWRW
jgi:hypothetical protein